MQKLNFISKGIAVALCFFQVCPAFCESAYLVGPGDELSVNFPLQGNLEDLSKLSGQGLSLQIIGEMVYWRHQVVVAPDGFIALPSLSPLKVSGQRLEEIQAAIESQFPHFSKKSAINVTLLRPNSAGFFVWGEVPRPGRFVFERPTTIVEALGIAGGTTSRSRSDRIQLIRRGQPSINVNLSMVQLKKTGAPEILLQPEDTVIVPKKVTTDTYNVFLFLTAITAVTGLIVATK